MMPRRNALGVAQVPPPPPTAAPEEKLDYIIRQLQTLIEISERKAMPQILTPEAIQSIYIADGMEGRVEVLSVELTLAVAAGVTSLIQFRIPHDFVGAHRTSAVITSNLYDQNITLDYVILDPGGKQRLVVPTPRRITDVTTVALGGYTLKYIGSDWQFTNNTLINIFLRLEFASIVSFERSLADEYLAMIQNMREVLRRQWRAIPA